MSDVPTNGADNTQTSSQSFKRNSGIHGRDIEDIDRELEAYLEEKRSGKSVGYHHSVEEQLSQIREKFGARVNPTKESEKSKEVEVVRDSLDNYQSGRERQSQEQLIPKKQGVSVEGEKASALSHEELIRSLEEKYSRGESPNIPPKATASAQTEVQSPREADKVAPASELSPILLDLKESIEPLSQSRIDALLAKAALFTGEEQKSLRETFFARFKRNKERMELYIKTQKELEDEFEHSVSGLGSSPRVEKTESVKSEEKLAPPVVEPQSKPLDVLSGQKTESAEVNTPLQVKETLPANVGMSALEQRYRGYLSRLEKKPQVLVYEPENGFVRKPVDPSDSTLTLTYSLDSSTNTAVLTVYDARGNELGVFKTPEKELDN